MASLLLGACAVPPPPPPSAVPPPPPPSPPSTEVYFYPTKGQSPQQQERDRYECYLWASKQTGFDPSAPNLAPHQRVRVVPTPPPGHDAAVGAATGALFGAAVSSHHHTGEGAVLGAITGAIIGSASDAARQEQANRVQRSYDQAAAQQAARNEAAARDYRRAMAACLEGRGYTVQP